MRRPKRTILKLTLGLVILGAVAPAVPAEPQITPLKVSSADVLKFLGAHAWKWTYRAPAAYQKISLRFLHFTRLPSGQFERSDLGGATVNFKEPHTADDILIVSAIKDGHANFTVSYGGMTFGVEERKILSMNEYVRPGDGDGGAPGMIGSEQVLMTRYKDQQITGRKEDLQEYVAVEIETSSASPVG